MQALHGRNTTDCAHAYATGLGWPVAAGHRYRRQAGCTCHDTDTAGPCPAPGAHPRTTPVEPLPPADVATVFNAEPGAGIITTCTKVDGVTLPHALGLALMLILDRHGIYTPCLTADHTYATLLVAPGTGHRLAGVAPVSVHSGPEAWLALPPSNGMRWDTPPTLHAPLPDAEAIRPHLERAVRMAARCPGAPS
ncbi:hypothetical protein [Streptomyces sp. NPDC058084]|uniref:hypothetical protein n=1 Tax=Streptomyces sp. NPDC058084 TaxID=3346333 RepID=UPI0036EDA17D